MTTPASFACSVPELENHKDPRVIVCLPGTATGKPRRHFAHSCEPAASSLAEIGRGLPTIVRLPPRLSAGDKSLLEEEMDELYFTCDEGEQIACSDEEDVVESTLTLTEQLSWGDTPTRQPNEQAWQAHDAQTPCFLSISHEVSRKQTTTINKQSKSDMLNEPKTPDGLARSQVTAQWRSWGALIWPATRPASRSYDRWTTAWESGLSPRLCGTTSITEEVYE